MRTAAEGLGTSNGAEGRPDHTSILVDAPFASSSPPHDHGSASASSSPSNKLSDGGTGCSWPPPTTTTVSGSNTTTSTSSGSADPNSIVPIGGPEARNIETQSDRPRRRHGNRNTEGEGQQDRNDADIPRERARDRNDADNDLFKLGKIFMGLTFQLGMALMIVRVQPQQGDSSTNLSSLSSILYNTVGATTSFCFVFTMLGMLLKEHDLTAAKFCNGIGILMGVLVFFLMISIFTIA